MKQYLIKLILLILANVKGNKITSRSLGNLDKYSPSWPLLSSKIIPGDLLLIKYHVNIQFFIRIIATN